jgi:prophage maintenance system killer protein
MSSTKAVATIADSAVYMSAGGEIQLDVPMDSNTVWLTQDQMAKLFGSSQRMMSYHVKNIFLDKELGRKGNIQKMYVAESDKPISLHSLDVIISVGYRVKSAGGVHFRRWATTILRERLIKSHHQRQIERERMETLGALASHVLTDQEARALLSIISRFSSSWQLLRQYDENDLPVRPASPTRRMKRLTLKQARAAITALKTDLLKRGEATDIFGHERGDGLEALLGNIEQTFGGEPLYPSVEERAAALLYFVIKDHPFIDGNKRNGSLLFVHYLEKNACLTRAGGSPRFDANALVAIALLVAESDPKQKDMVIRLVLAMLS